MLTDATPKGSVSNDGKMSPASDHPNNDQALIAIGSREIYAEVTGVIITGNVSIRP